MDSSAKRRSAGYNPLRWNCDQRGCFNKKKRPKIEEFSDCFPGRISFGDVDARVEINGQFLELEWKGQRGPIPVGQKLTFDRLIKRGDYTVFVIAGDAESMEIEAVQILRPDTNPRWREMDFTRLHKLVARWASWAAEQKKAPAGAEGAIR